MAAVDREDEPGVQGGVVVGLEGGDGVQQDRDVLVGGEMGRGARGGAQLEVDDAVVGEVAENRGGGVADRGRVGEEVVDVAAKEGEEADVVLVRCVYLQICCECDKWAHVLRS